jgi:hypothetical protein
MKTFIVGCGLVLMNLTKGEEEIRTVDKIKGSLIAIGAIFIVVWSSYVMLTNRKNLYKYKVEEKYGKMYADINKNSKQGILYFPVLIIRIIIFTLICSLFYSCQVFQVQCLMILNTAFTIWYFQSKPHLYRSRWRLQVFHETIKMIEAYHLFLFTNAFSFVI